MHFRITHELYNDDNSIILLELVVAIINVHNITQRTI